MSSSTRVAGERRAGQASEKPDGWLPGGLGPVAPGARAGQDRVRPAAWGEKRPSRSGIPGNACSRDQVERQLPVWERPAGPATRRSRPDFKMSCNAASRRGAVRRGCARCSTRCWQGSVNNRSRDCPTSSSREKPQSRSAAWLTKVTRPSSSAIKLDSGILQDGPTRIQLPRRAGGGDALGASASWAIIPATARTRERTSDSGRPESARNPRHSPPSSSGPARPTSRVPS